jgi:hypothetical protein
MLHSGREALPANIRLDRKGSARTNTSLLRKSVNYGHKKFYSTGPWGACIIKLITVVIYSFRKKLEC